jgi:hypothetical protein
MLLILLLACAVAKSSDGCAGAADTFTVWDSGTVALHVGGASASVDEATLTRTDATGDFELAFTVEGAVGSCTGPFGGRLDWRDGEAVADVRIGDLAGPFVGDTEDVEWSGSNLEGASDVAEIGLEPDEDDTCGIAGSSLAVDVSWSFAEKSGTEEDADSYCL